MVGIFMSNERVAIALRVNGSERSGYVEARTLLSDFLRHGLGLTGVHVGCEHGVCGACTILFNHVPVRSCLMFAVQAKQYEITTIEGVAPGQTMHPVQRAFQKHHGLQCGFCTPGMVITVIDLLRRDGNLNDRSVREGLSGNLCRCTGYEGIVAAVMDATQQKAKAHAADEAADKSREKLR
jgi:aerobic-type carbon monoxide dehydrogenase small subunit (CoxS/CutS family)